MVKVLLAAGVNCNVRDSGGRSSLHYAAENRQWEIVRELLADDPDGALIREQRYQLTWDTYLPIVAILLSVDITRLKDNYKTCVRKLIAWIQGQGLVEGQITFDVFIANMVAWFDGRGRDVNIDRLRAIRDGLVRELSQLRDYINQRPKKFVNHNTLLPFINEAVTKLEAVDFQSVSVKSARNVALIQSDV